MLQGGHDQRRRLSYAGDRNCVDMESSGYKNGNGLQGGYGQCYWRQEWGLPREATHEVHDIPEGQALGEQQDGTHNFTVAQARARGRSKVMHLVGDRGVGERHDDLEVRHFGGWGMVWRKYGLGWVAEDMWKRDVCTS